MDIPYSASHKALLYSLSVDTFLIIARANHGMSDEEIVISSGKWDFTLNRIYKAYMETCGVFGLSHRTITEARSHAVAVYEECRQQGLFRPSMNVSATQNREVMPMDAKVNDSHFNAAKRVASLTAHQHSFLAALVAGKTDQEVMRALKLSQGSFDEMVADILDFLKIDAKEPLSRRRILACSAFRHAQLHRTGAEMPSDPESQSQEKPRRGAAIRWEGASTSSSTHVPPERSGEMPSETRGRKVYIRHFNGVNVNTQAFKIVFADNVKMIARARGMTTRTVLQDADMSLSFMSNMRKGFVRLDEKKIRGIAQALKVEPEFLLIERILTSQEISNKCALPRGEPLTARTSEQTAEVVQPPPPRAAVVPSVEETHPPSATTGDREPSEFLNALIKEPKKAMAFAHLVAARNAFNTDERKFLVALLLAE